MLSEQDRHSALVIFGGTFVTIVVTAFVLYLMVVHGQACQAP
jgi:hypothetical protein